MRWALAILFIVLVAPSVYAIQMSCPPNNVVGVNEYFSIGVSQEGAEAIGLWVGGYRDEKAGSSYSWNLNHQSPTSSLYYYGDAKVNGTWIGDGSAFCKMVVVQPTDSPGKITLGAIPTQITQGTQISISASYSDTDGTNKIKIFDNGVLVSEKATCSGTSCSHIYYTTPTLGKHQYWATGRDTNGNEVYSDFKNVTVTSIQPNSNLPNTPTPSISPNPANVGQMVTFSVTATDPDGDLKRVGINYARNSRDKSCSSSEGSSCSLTFQDFYTAAGTYNIYAFAEDNFGNFVTGNSVSLQIKSNTATDADNDGVPDANEAPGCTGTTVGPVVKSGSPLGCSCVQIQTSYPQLMQGSEQCTYYSCSIDGSGTFTLNSAYECTNTQICVNDVCVSECDEAPGCMASCNFGYAQTTNEYCGASLVCCTCGQGYNWDDALDRCVQAGSVCTVSCQQGDGICQVGCGTGACPTDLDCGCTDKDGDGVCAYADCYDYDKAIGTTSTRACGSDVGECVSGIERCVNGDWLGVCEGEVKPQPEICDGKDNNCDRYIDETCGEITCNGAVCSRNPEVTSEDWVKNVCVEELYQTWTYYSATGCGDACIYETTTTTEKTTTTRNVANGTSCESGKLCSGGRCLAKCPTDGIPGCKVTAQDGFFKLDYACTTGACYKCADGLVWDGKICRDRGYMIDVASSFNVNKGSHVDVNPVLKREGGTVVSGWFKFSGVVSAQGNQGVRISGTTIGTDSLIITAYATSGLGEALATKTVAIHTLCTSSDQCCNIGDDYYTKGLACSSSQGSGLCRADGSCDVSAAKTFESSQQTCSDGIDNDQNGYIDCQVKNGQMQESCRQYCSVICQAPKVACGSTCVDLRTNHDNCGACGNDCGSSEICIAGSCEDQGPDCFVACSRDDQCGAGVECLKAGTCEAECKKNPLLELEEEEKLSLLTDIKTFKAYSIQKTIEGDELRITVKNLLSAPLRNFQMNITLPEELGVFIADYPYDTLHEEPKVISVLFEEVATTQRIILTFAEDQDAYLVNRVIVSSGHQEANLGEAKVLNSDELAITTTFSEVDGKTTAKLSFKPGATLRDVLIPLEIPKCLAESMKDIEFEQDNYEIIQDDPLMVWTFDTLNTEQEISFTIPKTVDEDCRSQIRAFGMAGDKRKPINPWLPLAIIPLIGAVLVVFQRVNEKGAQKHLSKKEFYQLGREQGHDDQDLERAWHDYQRRF